MKNERIWSFGEEIYSGKACGSKKMHAAQSNDGIVVLRGVFVGKPDCLGTNRVDMLVYRHNHIEVRILVPRNYEIKNPQNKTISFMENLRDVLKYPNDLWSGECERYELSPFERQTMWRVIKQLFPVWEQHDRETRGFPFFNSQLERICFPL